MSVAGDSVPMFTPEELETVAASVAEAQREFDAYCEWLRSPEGRAWGDQVLQEARAIAEEFKQDCVAGKYALSPAELDQLRRDAEAFAEEVRTRKFDLTPDEIKQLHRDGILTKCHPIKRGGDSSE